MRGTTSIVPGPVPVGSSSPLLDFARMYGNFFRKASRILSLVRFSTLAPVLGTPQHRSVMSFRFSGSLPATGTTTAPATSPAVAPAVTAGAIMALKDDRVLRAIDTLDSIIRTCRGAPTAGKAHELRRQLRSDPKADARLTRLIRGRLATRALNKARTYHQAGMHTKAIALYRGVIQDFGGTARAAEAAVLLETLEVASPGR